MARRNRASWTVAIGGALALAMLGLPLDGANPAQAQKIVKESAPKPPTIPALIEGLRANKFQEREAATIELMRLPANRLPDLEQALSTEEDPEVASRLTRAAIHLFLKAHTPLAGAVSLMGITLAIEPIQPADKEMPENSAVVVTGIQPGFPAAEQLVPGDRILSLDGNAFPLAFEFDDFRQMIARRRAGSYLQLAIRRGGKELNVVVQLAGVTRADAGAVANFVEERQRLTTEYLQHLQTQSRDKPLVLKSDPDATAAPFESEDVIIVPGR